MSKELNLTYEKNFSSPRADGRHVCTMAAHMAILRDISPIFALPNELTLQSFNDWKNNLKNKLYSQLNLPKVTPQPSPKLIYSKQREGYRAEKWEFYPDDYTAVPFIALIPDKATAKHPAPAVMCFLDSFENKEFVAGEPQLNHPNCQQNKDSHPISQTLAQNGMVAFVFDNPGMGECSVLSPSDLGETQSYIREILCHGLLETGCGYLGLTVFQRLRFISFLDCFPYADKNNIAISAHGLGTEAAIIVGILEDNIKSIFYGDVLKDPRRHYVSVTEQSTQTMAQDTGKWHILPEKMISYGYQDLCAAFAPRNLFLCDGSNEEAVNTVRRAYELHKSEASLHCGLTANNNADLTMMGLREDEFYSAPKYNVNNELDFFKKCFFHKP